MKMLQSQINKIIEKSKCIKEEAKRSGTTINNYKQYIDNALLRQLL